MGGWEYLKEVVNAERDNSAVGNGQSMGLIDGWGCNFFLVGRIWLGGGSEGGVW